VLKLANAFSVIFRSWNWPTLSALLFGAEISQCFQRYYSVLELANAFSVIIRRWN
jgi:hypothetical protein